MRGIDVVVWVEGGEGRLGVYLCVCVCVCMCVCVCVHVCV